MFDFMQMAGSPQARDMFFKMMSKQAGQASPEVREAIAKVEVIIIDEIHVALNRRNIDVVRIIKPRAVIASNEIGATFFM